MWESRVAPLSGVLFAVFLLGAFFTNPNTEFMPPTEDVVEFFEAGPRRAAAGAYLMLLAAVALLWFAGSLHSSIKGSDGDDGRLSVLALGGGILASAMLAVGGLVIATAAERFWMTGLLDSGVATAMFDLSGIVVGNGAPLGLGVMTAATGLALLRSADQPNWAGLLSVALGLGLVSPVAWALVALALLWVPAAAVWIYRREKRVSLVQVP